MASQDQPMYIEDEINLGKYVETLIRQWQVIVSAALIAAFVAGAVSLAMPQGYEASVLVASTKFKADISFGSSIQTLTEEELLASGAAAIVDRKARLQSYVQLVKNPAVAQTVLDELGDRLDEDELDVTNLLRMVEGDIAANSDSIEITVTYGNPVIAAELANAWGREYVRQVNAVYSGGVTEQSLVAVRDQMNVALVAYNDTLKELIRFLEENRIDELNRQINEKQTIINSLANARSTAIDTIVSEQTLALQQVTREYYSEQAKNLLLALQGDLTGRRELVTAYINAINRARQAVFDEQIQDQLDRFSRLYSDIRRIDQLLNDAMDMRDQVQFGGAGAAASNALALTLLKAQVYAAHGGLGEVQLQTSPGTMSATAMVTDLDALIDALEARKMELEAQIQSSSESFLAGGEFNFLDAPLFLEDPEVNVLISAVINQYPELFKTGRLAELSLEIVDDEEKNQLVQQALNYSQALLELGELDELLFSTEPDSLELGIRDLEQQVRELEADLEMERDKERKLFRSRDLAWSTFSSLATRTEELNVAVGTTGIEVALASPAAVPDQDTVSGVRNVMLAGAVGLMLGVFAAYAIEFWWGYKGLEPEPIAVFSIAVGGVREAWSRTRTRLTGRKKREIDNDNEQGS